MARAQRFLREKRSAHFARRWQLPWPVRWLSRADGDRSVSVRITGCAVSPAVDTLRGTRSALMLGMTTIDATLLATVTGGRQQQQQQQQQSPQADEQGGGGSFMTGLDQFLGFLQTPTFSSLIGQLRGLLGQFGGQPQAAQPQEQDQPQQ